MWNIDFICSSCSQIARAAQAGQSLSSSACGAVLTVPTPAASSIPPGNPLPVPARGRSGVHYQAPNLSVFRIPSSPPPQALLHKARSTTSLAAVALLVTLGAIELAVMGRMSGIGSQTGFIALTFAISASVVSVDAIHAFLNDAEWNAELNREREMEEPLKNAVESLQEDVL